MMIIISYDLTDCDYDAFDKELTKTKTISNQISYGANANNLDLPNSTLQMAGNAPNIGITTLQQITNNSGCTLSKAIATIINNDFAYIDTSKGQRFEKKPPLPYAEGIIVHYDIKDDDPDRSHSNAIKNILIGKPHWKNYVVNSDDLPASSVYLQKDSVSCMMAIDELVNVANLYAIEHTIEIDIRAIATPLSPYRIHP